MTNNVHVLPTRRMPGRRTTRPVPGAADATVLSFRPQCDAVETAEQRLARIDEATKRMARHLLLAVRTFHEINDVLESG
ncbi:hypothetical protein B0G75_104254 [Paraburkholderia sp. BL18I3N2]|uniref:hypothetical protein n=1 Tax=Paraburkholderia sp. BL18I3N2 TaxID=1938799 RepID=UPI000D3FC787|nr:hypothetical protein [Paraburkholderia sp. BL18I3N2]PRX32233.1 hypothetical protein B0G75_104254 [Paraburkholderia sp. BL18I3N2]